MPATALITSPQATPATPAAYQTAYEKFEQLVAQLRAPQAQSMTHSALENLIEREGREVLRRLLQAHLDQRSPGSVTPPVRDAHGQPLTHQRIHTRQLESIFGTLQVTRTGYGGRGLGSLHPLDAQLNLPAERYSHSVRRRAAELAAAQSFDQVVEALSAVTGAQVPKRQAEQLVTRAAQDFEAFYLARRPQTPAEVCARSEILVITSDGKGVPMCRADLRAATRQAAAVREPRLRRRRSKGEKSGTKRMATVAAVYTIAPFVRTPEQIVRELHPAAEAPPVARPRPEGKRAWASLEQPPEGVLWQAFEEAARRDPKRQKRWCALPRWPPLSTRSAAAGRAGLRGRVGDYPRSDPRHRISLAGRLGAAPRG